MPPCALPIGASHVDDLCLDRLDAVFGPEDTDLGHAVVSVDLEAVGRGRFQPRQRGLRRLRSPTVAWQLYGIDKPAIPPEAPA